MTGLILMLYKNVNCITYTLLPSSNVYKDMNDIWTIYPDTHVINIYVVHSEYKDRIQSLSSTIITKLGDVIYMSEHESIQKVGKSTIDRLDITGKWIDGPTLWRMSKNGNGHGKRFDSDERYIWEDYIIN